MTTTFAGETASTPAEVIQELGRITSKRSRVEGEQYRFHEISVRAWARHPTE